jgi:hypothetical protein
MRLRPLLGSLAVVSASLIGGCNAILGYDAATLEQSAVDAGPGTPCDAYCTAIMSACTGANKEYLDSQVCKDMCSKLDPGVAGDTTQNSLECRMNHIAAAQTNPAVGCPQAGPTGAGVCGTNPCTAWCSLDYAYCSTQPTPPYTSETACDMACGNFPYDPSQGDLAHSAGDTLNCRIYHLESAYDVSVNSTAASFHCPHTAVQSATCVNPDGG